VGGPRAARRAEQALAGLPRETTRAAAEALRLELDLWPLYLSGARLGAGVAVRGEAAPSADGAVDLGDLWRAAVPP